MLVSLETNKRRRRAGSRRRARRVSDKRRGMRAAYKPIRCGEDQAGTPGTNPCPSHQRTGADYSVTPRNLPLSYKAPAAEDGGQSSRQCCINKAPLSNDNYNSFSGDSYFSRLFWVKSARFFWCFLGLVFCFRWRRLSAAGGWRPKAGASVARRGVSSGLNCRRQLPLCCVVPYGSLLGDSRRQIPG
jgi:hypothetical protein